MLYMVRILQLPSLFLATDHYTGCLIGILTMKCQSIFWWGKSFFRIPKIHWVSGEWPLSGPYSSLFQSTFFCFIQFITPLIRAGIPSLKSWNSHHNPWKWMVGIPVSFWDGLFFRCELLVLGRVSSVYLVIIITLSRNESAQNGKASSFQQKDFFFSSDQDLGYLRSI